MNRKTLEYDSSEDQEYPFTFFEEDFNSLWSESLGGTQVHVRDHRRRQYDTTYSSGGEFLREIIDGLGAFRISAVFHDELCSVTLYSHDAPTGANFEIVEA